MEKKRFNRLKSILADKGLKNQDFAEIMQVSEQTISRWAANTRQPDLETLFSIAEKLDVDPCDLLQKGKIPE